MRLQKAGNVKRIAAREAVSPRPRKTQSVPPLRRGGKRSSRFEKGYFFEPTVLSNVPQNAKMMTEEPFSPVMPLLAFSNVDDVIRELETTNTSERAGRAMDHESEDAFERLRVSGYL